jgi:hypothetical protein
MSRKKIITVVSIILGCALILVVVVGVLVYKSIISPLLAMNEVPPELQKPRVITGADLLVKSDFYRAGKGTSWGELLDPKTEVWATAPRKPGHEQEVQPLTAKTFWASVDFDRRASEQIELKLAKRATASEDKMFVALRQRLMRSRTGSV